MKTLEKQLGYIAVNSESYDEFVKKVKIEVSGSFDLDDLQEMWGEYVYSLI